MLCRFEATITRVEALNDQIELFCSRLLSHLDSLTELPLLHEIGEPLFACEDAFGAATVHRVVEKAIQENLKAPLAAISIHMEETSVLIRQRHDLMLDYTHHRHKFQAIEEKLLKVM